MELLLIRHGEPVRIEQAGGPADPALHHRGREQAGRLADWLAAERLDVLWASPLRRARETADAISRRLAVPVQIDPALAEWDRDAPEYIPLEELKAEGDARWQALLSGQYFAESVDPVAFRAGIVTAIETIVAANPGRTVAVVCHGGVINMYASWVLGLPERHFFLPRYTSVSRVAAARTGQRSVVSLNETGHLRGLPGF
jgi:broad specificity phosphatase PhoE